MIKSKDWKYNGGGRLLNMPRKGYLLVRWQGVRREQICWYFDYLNTQRETLTIFDLADFSYREDGPASITIDNNGKVWVFYRNSATIKERQQLQKFVALDKNKKSS